MELIGLVMDVASVPDVLNIVNMSTKRKSKILGIFGYLLMFIARSLLIIKKVSATCCIVAQNTAIFGA